MPWMLGTIAAVGKVQWRWKAAVKGCSIILQMSWQAYGLGESMKQEAARVQ